MALILCFTNTSEAVQPHFHNYHIIINYSIMWQLSDMNIGNWNNYSIMWGLSDMSIDYYGE